MSSHLRLGLPNGLFPVGLPIKILKALLPSSILASSSEALWIFLNKGGFYSVRFLASRQTPKLEDHSWSAVHDSLFNIFAANSHGLWHSVVAWMRNLSVPRKTMVSTLLSVIISTGRPLPPSPLRVLEVHINGVRGISILIIESKIHISYLKNRDSTLMLSSIIFTCHPF